MIRRAFHNYSMNTYTIGIGFILIQAPPAIIVFLIRAPFITM